MKFVPLPRKEKSCVPFRESKLTQIFQNYFVSKGRGMREGRVMMFVNVSPSPVVFDETLNVLEVSSIASKVSVGRLVCVCVCGGGGCRCGWVSFYECTCIQYVHIYVHTNT